MMLPVGMTLDPIGSTQRVISTCRAGAAGSEGEPDPTAG